MAKPIFTGVIPPVVTLFDKSGRIDIKGNQLHAAFLIARGVNGLAYLGTTGEFGVMTLSEKCRFLSQMTEYSAGKVKVLAGVSDTCLANVLYMARQCESMGVDGLLLLPPYFSVYSQEMLSAFFSHVADSTRLPIILYNFPALTGFCMEDKWVKALIMKHRNIVGIKETVQDIPHIYSMLRLKEARPDFSVFAAYDNQFWELMQGPAVDAVHSCETSLAHKSCFAIPEGSCPVDGFIHAAGNYAPEAAVAFYRAAGDGDLSKMRPAFRNILIGMKIYDESQPLFLAVKQAVYERTLGYEGGERLPGRPLDEEHKENIRKIVSELIKGADDL